MKKKNYEKVNLYFVRGMHNYYNPSKRREKVWKKLARDQGDDIRIKKWFYSSVRAFQVLMAFFYSTSSLYTHDWTGVFKNTVGTISKWINTIGISVM